MILELVTPQGLLLREVGVTGVNAPTTQGRVGILPDHRPSFMRLGGGSVYYEGKRSGLIFVRGGFLEITGENVILMADEAMKPEDTDSLTLNLRAGLSLKGFVDDEMAPVAAQNLLESAEDPHKADQKAELLIEQQIENDFNQAIRDYLEAHPA